MATVRTADLPTTDTDVLVVGAGPTGLMAGLVLTRCGVPVVVVDQKAGPTRESRALVLQARTMEIYDQLGLADQSEGRVVALLEGPHGLIRVRARWCIGADGARSAVLRQLDNFTTTSTGAPTWATDRAP